MSLVEVSEELYHKVKVRLSQNKEVETLPNLIRHHGLVQVIGGCCILTSYTGYAYRVDFDVIEMLGI